VLKVETYRPTYFPSLFSQSISLSGISKLAQAIKIRAASLDESEAHIDWLGPKIGGRLALSPIHSSNEPGELSPWLCHDDRAP